MQNQTTDMRTIYRRDIALDPVNGGPRLLARVQTTFPDGVTVLKIVNGGHKAFLKNGTLEKPSSCGEINLGRHVIVWQGDLPGHDRSDTEAGLLLVEEQIAAGESRIPAHDDIEVAIRRGAIMSLVDMLSTRNDLDDATRAAIEEVRHAAA